MFLMKEKKDYMLLMYAIESRKKLDRNNRHPHRLVNEYRRLSILPRRLNQSTIPKIAFDDW